ncbi:MAG TPA: hypothetical protein VER33_20825, partial [Polyangiaceae bacterium]|nr:hypothetical protein [Polyangiaceae bacterium]
MALQAAAPSAAANLGTSFTPAPAPAGTGVAPAPGAPAPGAPQPFAPQTTPTNTGVATLPTAGPWVMPTTVPAHLDDKNPSVAQGEISNSHAGTYRGGSNTISTDNRAYNLGGNREFVADMSAATQSVANRGATKIQGQGDAAMDLGIRADMDLSQRSQDATAYGNNAATQGSALASGLTNAGSRLETGANAAQTRAAPLADATAQNSMLGQASTSLQAQAATANAMGTQAGALAQQGAAAAGRSAPVQSTGAQDAALGAAGRSAGTLGSAAEQLMALGNGAGGRATPDAEYGASRAQLGQLTGLEAQQGPSGAQAMLNQGAAQSMQQNLALARSGRGFGGNAQATAEALRSNAATMQGVGNQSAMLRAQEDAAWRGRQAQNLTTSAGMLSQQASQAQAAQLQGRQINDAAQAQMFGLGTDATARSAAVQQANAAQYGQQSQFNVQSAQQQTALNDSATAQLMGLSQQGLTAQGQLQGQNAAGLQASAGQYGQQSQFQAQQQLASRQANDAYAAQLSGQAIQARQ